MNIYRIANKRGTFLTAFHSNGGFEIADVFPCSQFSWVVFPSHSECEIYIAEMEKICEEQRDRWGEWTDKALAFVRTLHIAYYGSTDK